MHVFIVGPLLTNQTIYATELLSFTDYGIIVTIYDTSLLKYNNIFEN